MRWIPALAIVLGLTVVNLLPGCQSPARSRSEDEARFEELFVAYAERHDSRARKRILALGDEAVPFLVDTILEQESDPEGEEETHWPREASSILTDIDTPGVVAAARQLAGDDDEEVRYWGILTLTACRTERQKNATFLRDRIDAETSWNRVQIVEFLGQQRDPDDLPLLRELRTTETNLNAWLALLYAIALQGDRDAREALLKIVQACEDRSDHLGVEYLERVTGRDYGWDTDRWRQWLEATSDESLGSEIDRQARRTDSARTR